MELHEYVAILRKRWLTVTVVTALGLALAVLATVFATPMYTATTKTFVSVRSGDTVGDLVQGSTYSQSQVRSYAQLATMPAVLDPVIEDLGLTVGPGTLSKAISVTVPQNTVIISISVTDPSAERAAAIANAVASHLSQAVSDLAPTPATGSDPIRLSTVAEAGVPGTPSSPDAKVNLAIGLVLGLALGIAAAVGQELLDTRVRNEDDLRKVTDASVIGSIPLDGTAEQSPLVVQGSPQSPRAEAFRRLRTNLQFLDVGERSRAIVLVSAIPAEGKSTTAINLAITLADAGSRVALVDADLRRPSIASYLGIEGNVGLTTVLIGQATLDDVLQPWGSDRLDVLASGQIPPNPSELLGSRAMSAVLSTLTERYDVVLLDTAPLLPVTDGAVLAKLAGGALVAVGAGTVSRHQLAEALGSLESVDARVLGVVLNKLTRRQGDRYPYYDYYASEGSTRAATGATTGGTTSGGTTVADPDPVGAARHVRSGGGAKVRLWPGARVPELDES
ncbi:polysaccharide biosynthesis tyrosine autokinase [Cellulomonas sp.]|uniref:polysaccharide biosynthesis tyrosine autokinase n=1 Tax=Cellulomonas sp. TaxID=40001 RepID=UPI001B2C087D|nr:polysaccharide biosynthesis tyrosine autokinase [Cellulomonas sp.]MBO9553125.1 polysaccharide biosynthesis tyrosine autokinase [Cellulomonas sp.]